MLRHITCVLTQTGLICDVRSAPSLHSRVLSSETGWTATGIIIVVNASRFLTHNRSYSVWAFPLLFAQVAVLLGVRFIAAIRTPEPLPPLAHPIPSVSADQPRTGTVSSLESGLPALASQPSLSGGSAADLTSSGGVLADGAVHEHAQTTAVSNASSSSAHATGSKVQDSPTENGLFRFISRLVGGRAHLLFYLLLLLVGGWGRVYNKRMSIDRTYGMDSEYVICVSCVFICLTIGELLWQGERNLYISVQHFATLKYDCDVMLLPWYPAAMVSHGQILGAWRWDFWSPSGLRLDPQHPAAATMQIEARLLSFCSLRPTFIWTIL